MRFFLLSLSLFLTNAGHACETAQFSHDEKQIKVCYDKKTERYLSIDCKNIATCFLTKKIDFQFRQDQSPGFSLCYQLGGSPFFAKVSVKKETVPMCFMKPYYIDQETLFLEFKKVKP